MKYRNILLLSLLFLAVSVSTQAQSNKPKRPAKSPPQYPNIIDLESKDAPPSQPSAQPANATPTAPAEKTDPLVQAVSSLAGELKNLSQELKALNVRQQVEIELLRMSRIELRINTYEGELRPIRQRIAALEAEEQSLQQLMTRDGLLAQTANTATINREATMQQIRTQLEVRFRAVQEEKERLRKLEVSQMESLNIYQRLSDETEQKIQQAEEKLRQLETGKLDSIKQDRNQ